MLHVLHVLHVLHMCVCVCGYFASSNCRDIVQYQLVHSLIQFV